MRLLRTIGLLVASRQSAEARPIFRASGALSVAIRRGEPDEKIADLRRDLRAAQLEKYVREIVDKAPPLTAEQRDRIAALLRAPIRESGAA